MTGAVRAERGDSPVHQVSVEAGRGRCRLWGTAVVTAGGVALTLVGGEQVRIVIHKEDFPTHSSSLPE